MKSKISTNVLLSYSLILAICFSGYIFASDSSWADLTGTNGMVTIDSKVIIRQGNGVNYTFGNTEVLSRLEVKATSIKLDGWFEIGATVSTGYLNNVIYDWGKTYTRWTGTATNSTAQVTYSIIGLSPNAMYDIVVDGAKYRVMTSDSSGRLVFSYVDGWSSHTFVVSHSGFYPGLQASFEYHIDGNTVYFTDTSHGSVIMWMWDFGDGYTSNLQHPTHKYNREGVYTVTLSVQDASGQTATTTKTIRVGALGGFAGFSFIELAVLAGITIAALAAIAMSRNPYIVLIFVIIIFLIMFVFFFGTNLGS